MCFYTIKVNAQNYLISFAGTGSSVTVSTVKVENLTKGTILTISGSDILRLTTVTGINSIEDNQSSELKIYPNPMNDNATLEIFPPIEGNAIISVYDLTGKPVALIQSYLENSWQNFRLSGLKSGYYFINIKGDNYLLSGKLVSNGGSNAKTSIERVNNVIQSVDPKTVITDSKGTQATVDMVYNTGDRLKFTGISGNYSTVKTDIPASNKTITFNFIACTDGDNNNYPVVEIGNQVWMAENLKTTRYKNGTAIPLVADNAEWNNLTTPAYCWYDNNELIYKDAYGALYNWYTVNTGNVCPSGWHVPADAELATLTNYLGGLTDGGGKLKETGTTHWLSPNIGATNESGFTTRPGGVRHFGVCTGIGYSCTLSSATEFNAADAWNIFLFHHTVEISRFNENKSFGHSVRCLRD